MRFTPLSINGLGEITGLNFEAVFQKLSGKKALQEEPPNLRVIPSIPVMVKISYCGAFSARIAIS
jgi:hypothetical protein